MVGTLLRIAYRDWHDHLEPAKEATHPQFYPLRLSWGVEPDAFRFVLGLGNINLIVSYLFIVWSERSSLGPSVFHVMLNFIKEGFRGIESV